MERIEVLATGPAHHQPLAGYPQRASVYAPKHASAHMAPGQFTACNKGSSRGLCDCPAPDFNRLPTPLIYANCNMHIAQHAEARVNDVDA